MRITDWNDVDDVLRLLVASTETIKRARDNDSDLVLKLGGIVTHLDNLRIKIRELRGPIDHGEGLGWHETNVY